MAYSVVDIPQDSSTARWLNKAIGVAVVLERTKNRRFLPALKLNCIREDRVVVEIVGDG